MANNIETIYDQAIKMLKTGSSQEEVLVKFAEFKNELAPLLSLSAGLLGLPKNIVPTPLMQRKYALAPAKNFLLAWFHSHAYIGASASLMLVISVFSFMGYRTYNSAPGQTLFAVKKSAEKLQVILASNQGQKANLQIQIAQKRLNEAEQIFNNPDSNVEQKKAALTELADQTSTAIAQVNTVTKNDPNSEENRPLLNSLENITKEQEGLLKDIKPDDQIEVATDSALKTLNENTVKISEIKQSVAIAGNDRALAQLKADPNSVTALGDITKISKENITVEKTTFVITSQTVVKDASGKTLSLKDLNEKTKVNVIALKNNDNDNLVAQQILVIAPEVKGVDTVVADSKPVTATGAPISIKKPVDGNQNSSSTDITVVEPDPNIATGSFILEDPAPQFAE